ncbi:MAG: hypothetical protein AB4206_20565 [Xenococcaceae cyanobacterium]
MLVKELAPPIPSICRLSGEPITAKSILSLKVGSSGRSDFRKKAPREVPPRINKQGIDCENFECFTFIRNLQIAITNPVAVEVKA